MPRTAEVFSAKFGSTEHKMLDLEAVLVGDTTMKVTALPQGLYRGRNYAIFVNGVFQGMRWAPLTQPMEFDFPFDYGTEIGSIEVIEVGVVDGWDPGQEPNGWVLVTEQESADRLAIRWSVSPQVDESTSKASTTITSISLTGLDRWTNCEPDKGDVQRGKVYITCNENRTDSTWVFRFWAWGQLVAEGDAAAGDPLAITEANSSGVSGTALVGASPSDILMGEDWVIARWPETYNIHYDTSPLSFPRTADEEVDDTGIKKYIHLTPTLDHGSWYYTVQSVSEEGVEDPTPPTPTDSPKEIFSVPEPAVITSITGNCLAGLLIEWTASPTPGVYYTIYSSGKDLPVNFWTWSLPTSYSVPEGETSVVHPAITDFSPRTYDPDVIITAFRSEVDDLNDAYEAGQSGYQDQLSTSLVALAAYIKQYEVDVDVSTETFIEDLAYEFQAIQKASDEVESLSVTDAQWRERMQFWHSQLLVWLSMMLTGKSGAYTFKGGQAPFAADPTGATSIGPASDGSSVGTFSEQGEYLLQLIEDRFEGVNELGVPTENAKFRFIIRATSSEDVQERTDKIFTIEVDSNGDVVPIRPNSAQIQSVTWSGMKATFLTVVKRDNEDVTPTHVDLFAITDPLGTFDWTDPVASVAIGDDSTDMYVQSVDYTFPATGFYNVAVKARVSSTGAVSAKAASRWIKATNVDPDQVDDVSAEVIRGRQAVLPQEE